MKNLTKPLPFLRWVGGKRNLLSVLQENLPDEFRNYYEPFAGSAALFFDIHGKCKSAYISDLNKELVYAYLAVKNNPDEVVEKLRFHYKNHSKEYYYFIRGLHSVISDPITRAARFIYLNRTCFNGLYRENSKGEFNVPPGNNKINIQDLSYRVYLCSEALKDTIINHKDFMKIKPRKGDFVYLDPPYFKEKALSFTKYLKYDFTVQDHIRLKEFCDKLHTKGVKFMLSNSDSSFIKDLYRDYNIKRINSRRNINPKSKNRNTTELLVKNY